MQLILWILTIALLTTTTASNFWISWISAFFGLVLVLFAGSLKSYIATVVGGDNKDLPATSTTSSPS
jgi:uncharacterized membrane protein YgdD (TMEM256/DUF423 family)